MSAGWRAPIAAAAASVGLIAAYLAFGGASFHPAGVADPCRARDASLLGERGVFEAIALSSLDGAACELGVSREELTLALADESATQRFADAHGLDESRIEEAVRAGLVRAVDDQAAAGRIDGIEESILRELVENAPVRAVFSALRVLPGGDSPQALLEQLGPLSQLDGEPDIPPPDELDRLIP